MKPTTPQAQTLLNSDYGKSSKQLIDIVGQLRALGAHLDNIELPRVVVIGNQSAGKSSLVEAISGISVPRDAGTCTRCPMECRLSHSTGSWTCQIKIRTEYAADGCSRLDEVTELPFGPCLTDKNEVEPMLRRAQAAILNPHMPAASFVNMDNADIGGASVGGKKPLAFSRNIVCVELSGPELADLSFVDLPGIVQNAEKELVTLVEDLVKSYISGNSLILVTLPMSDDIENQKAARLAKEADPSGERTIGVMTKPDTLSAGSTKARDLWLEVLEGRRHPLRHGYYCTRQPDDDERARGVSGIAARDAELAFFRSTPPWATSSHQRRFGTTHLVQNVSKLLTQIIRKALPTIREQVALNLAGCTSHLDRLPEPITDDPASFVYKIVTDFCIELNEMVRGSPENAELVQASRRAFCEFKAAIHDSAPPFVPYENAHKIPGKLVIANSVAARAVMYLEDVRAHLAASITRELPGNVPYAAKLRLLERFQETWDDSTLRCFRAVEQEFSKFIVLLVHSHFERYPSLASIIKPVMVDLAHGCAADTIAQLRFLLRLETTPFTQNDHYFNAYRDKWLAKFKDARAGDWTILDLEPCLTIKRSPVPSVVVEASDSTPAMPTSPHQKRGQATQVQTEPKRRKARTTTRTPATPAAPADDPPPSTPQSVFGKRAPTNVLATPTAVSPPNLASTFFKPAAAKLSQEEHDALVPEALATLARLGYTGLTEEDLGRLRQADEYEDELAVMAEVRAYFQVAYKRVIDYIPMAIDHQFLFKVAEAARTRLPARLGIVGTPNATEKCAAYIEEDAGIVALRDELTAKKKRLEAVNGKLQEFGMPV
ncbi:P-loop containing nucleoside triphosphate hydrolase protein [Epithele typhae]|uniref:P-loop containing nucleoside triphosphate hydrolase protein n=1 Tax=Epithele typhae TaxID=378194 RepID=UPI0020074D8C|nr:P-loop containing nucleoside triphosphate hydrolase protein [Epithele typhae]KAH9937926.1 P-loop containing nucleoside triphosphate hydrolase protein [Epithele typhae]